MISDPFENAVESIRIRVVEKVDGQWIAGPAERVGDELRTESGAANPNQEDVTELSAFFGRNFSAVNVSGELFDSRVGLVNVRPQFRGRRKFRSRSQ
jgi:hypothetical protein